MIHAFQRVAGACHGFIRAFDLDLVAACRDVDAQPVLDLHEIGVELAEDGPQQHGFIEIQFDTRPTLVFGAELRRISGTGCFSGHALLSCEMLSRPDPKMAPRGCGCKMPNERFHALRGDKPPILLLVLSSSATVTVPRHL
ncbi:hypothetical protein ACFSHP_00605 [Novosphingobium panipatense]